MASLRSSSGGLRVGTAAAATLGKGEAAPARKAPAAPVSFATPTSTTNAFADFDPSSLEKVVALVGDRDETVVAAVRQILWNAGVKQIHAHTTLAPLAKIVSSSAPDLIIVGDDLDPNLFGIYP